MYIVHWGVSDVKIINEFTSAQWSGVSVRRRGKMYRFGAHFPWKLFRLEINGCREHFRIKIWWCSVRKGNSNLSWSVSLACWGRWGELNSDTGAEHSWREADELYQRNEGNWEMRGDGGEIDDINLWTSFRGGAGAVGCCQTITQIDDYSVYPRSTRNSTSFSRLLYEVSHSLLF